VVTHQLQVERRTGKVRRPETDVLPLCHATNHGIRAVIPKEEKEMLRYGKDLQKRKVLSLEN